MSPLGFTNQNNWRELNEKDFDGISYMWVY
jgi:hypothetical protein